MSLKVEPILCLQGLMDNYAYFVQDTHSGSSAVIDASEAAPIIQYCDKNAVKPDYIFVTHHHEDHTAGNAELKNKYGLKIVASEVDGALIDDVDIALQDGETFRLGEVEARIIAAPGHTQGHILWYFPQDKKLFTGDVLFNLCIGGLFEGTAEQMWQSLQKIKALPDDVCFYPGHEYSRAGVGRLLRRLNDEDKQYLDFLEQNAHAGTFPVGISLGLEKKCNPYLRINNEREFMKYFSGE